MTSNTTTTITRIIPSVKHKHQFHWLYHSVHQEAYLFYLFKHIISSKLYDDHNLQQQLWSFLEQLIQQNTLNDEQIYNQLFNFYQAKKKPHNDQPEYNRVVARDHEVITLLHTVNFTPTYATCWLDIGCNNGTITNTLAETLGLSKSQAHGCDIQDIHATNSIDNNNDKFTFSLSTPSSLPYNDHQFDLITALMSFHHMENLDIMMKELIRVSRPGITILILREHDVQYSPHGVLLDVVHGLYAKVWSNPQECDNFCDSYYASYRSRHQWRDMLKEYRWQSIHKTNEYAWDTNYRLTKNPQRIYYEVFRLEGVKTPF